jgi:hypothetical protein
MANMDGVNFFYLTQLATSLPRLLRGVKFSRFWLMQFFNLITLIVTGDQSKNTPT